MLGAFSCHQAHVCQLQHPMLAACEVCFVGSVSLLRGIPLDRGCCAFQTFLSNNVLQVAVQLTGSEGTMESIGRWGEEYVYRYVAAALEQLAAAPAASSDDAAAGAAGSHGQASTALPPPPGLLAALGDGPYEVAWVNAAQESGLPYDLTVTDASGAVVYIEVKSSVHHSKFLFPMSFREVEFAAREGRRYLVYRVFGAGSGAPSVLSLMDPARLWHYKAISICMQV